MLVFLFITCVFATVLADNLCPGVDTCTCSHQHDGQIKSNMSMRCTDSFRFPNVTDYNLKNKIDILKLTGSNMSSADYAKLKYYSSVTQFQLYYPVGLAYFNWNWLKGLAIEEFNWNSRERVEFASSDAGECDISDEVRVRSVRVRIRNMTTMPTCLPNTTAIISVSSRHFLDGEGGNVLDQFYQSDGDHVGCHRWPISLRLLVLSELSFARLTRGMFCAAPASFTTLYLRNCRHVFEELSDRHLPDTLTTLKVYSCHLGTVGSLTRLHGLRILYLRNTSTARVPTDIPPTLTSLDLTDNLIERADHLDRFPNLTSLSLARNRLTAWPPSLRAPRLEHLDLSRNSIEFVPSPALLAFPLLRTLDLTSNRLLNYPANLPATLSFLYLESNRIRNPPADVDWRAKEAEKGEVRDFPLVVRLRNNTLTCDRNLFDFIHFAASRHAHLTLSGFCRPFLDAVNRTRREELFRALSYYKDELGCRFNIEQLECQHLTTHPRAADPSLYTLDITNSTIPRLPDSVYANQTALERFMCDNCGMMSIPHGLPRSLYYLYLSRNNITHVTMRDGDELVALSKLRRVDLSHNAIKHIDPYNLRGLAGIERLFLVENPLDCQCSTFFFQRWLNYAFPAARMSPLDIFYHPACATPARFQHRLVTSLYGFFNYECMDFTCYLTDTSTDKSGFKFDINCTKNEVNPYYPWKASNMVRQLNTVFSPINGGLFTVTNSNLTDDDIRNITRLQNFHVDFSGNRLTRFPSEIFGEFTKTIDVSRNLIETLPASDEISALGRLEAIDLRENRIRMIHPRSVLVLRQVARVSLAGNPLSCECEQRALMTWIESVREQLPFSNTNSTATTDFGFEIAEMRCDAPDELRGRRLVDESTAAQFELKCPVAGTRRVHAGLLVTAVLAPLLLLIAISWLLNRQLDRRRRARESRNVVSGFKQLLERCDADDDGDGKVNDGEYKYDAFVSYANQDEALALRLVRDLESGDSAKPEGNRVVCLHERDFVAGAGIVDNIVACIGGSRRVVMVISRHFCASSWCQYEVQVALALMHKRRKGKFLVPVLVQEADKDEKIRGNVKTILSEIAGIVAPEGGHQADDAAWKEFCREVDTSLPPRV